MPELRDNPHSAFNFQVVIDGLDDANMRAGFSEVGGLGAEIVPVEYRQGNEPAIVRKTPGLQKYSNVTLKHGITGDLRLWNWMKQGLYGQVQRSNVTIVMLDEAQRPVMTFKLRDAWPVKYVGPALDASSSTVAIETIELCHEGLEIE